MAVGLVALMALVSAVSFLNSTTSAGPGPKEVDGIVTGSSGPVNGADVTINVRNKTSGQVVATLYATTSAGGFYTVTFERSSWEIGDTIEVIATYGAESGTNSVFADGEPFQTVNVALQPVIPEFPGFSFIVVLTVSTALLLGVGRVRRHC